jgi:hypothetical protein
VRGDARSFQVALVADSLVNPAGAEDSILDLLAEEGWGAIQLPPAGLDDETTASWLDQVAEHVAEFRRNDYSLVALLDDGLGAPELDSALAALEVEGMPRLDDARDKRGTRAFLRRHARQPRLEDRTRGR